MPRITAANPLTNYISRSEIARIEQGIQKAVRREQNRTDQPDRILEEHTMKSFIEMFTAARAVSTPTVAIRTFDPISTITTIQASLGAELAELTPFITWDSIHGLRGLTDKGTTAAQKMASEAGMELGASVDLPIALGLLEHAQEDVLAFILNPQLVWEEDKKVIQGIANLRNDYKARGNMLGLLIGIGDTIPSELQQDTLLLDHPLPTREELANVVRETYAFAYSSDPKKYKACKDGPSEETVAKAVDALIGIPLFPAEQACAMELNNVTGVLDIASLWTRKKTIVSQQKGLTYRAGGLTLKDLYGVESFKTYGKRLMSGSKPPTVILRMDEIQRQLSGNDTDSSGVKGDLLGEWLTWVNDHDIYCTLLLGVPGSSKSHSIDCIAGEYGRPVIDYSISHMQDSLVGNSNKNMRTANSTVDSISDKNVWLVATANKLDGLPPELLSRFADIFFFDAPDADELAGIMNLKLEAYGLDKQPHPDMTGWTGRDVKNCAIKAKRMNSTVVECGEYIIPLMTSQKEAMESLRANSSDRFLSASKLGTYQYTPPQTRHTPTAKIVEGRKVR
jgi:hypothetical protein